MAEGSVSHVTEPESPRRTIGARVAGWFGATILVIVVLVLFVHVTAPAIAPETESPAGHPQSMCVACHMVTSGGEARP